MIAGLKNDALYGREETPAPEALNVHGVNVVAGDAGRTARWLLEGLTLDEQGRWRRRRRVAFLNAGSANLAAADPFYRRLLSSFVVLNDGIGLDIAARWSHGRTFPANLNGTDFVPYLLGRSDRSLRIHLVGGRPGVAEAAARVLAERFPRHEIVGAQHGYFTGRETDEVVARVAESRADVLLVAMGNPVQERFVAAYFDDLDVGLAIGVGALLDFLSGRVSRAPHWMRRMRVEWVWRLAQEPRRLWSRYLVGNVVFLARTIRAPRS
ncbi:WecB/TagA/CpsF family glycosyltransferase [Nocardioides yefusunii]|uniref:WecB/TagA/CpsF family glycosyltransferase n=1 Tax=Nocardioides yefusunii TaxID=2500546 RepID=A0ABW1QVF8_9ACTN|nr:WecB/TagA/CpsF family glycosyltransferase [Nocardioides yefusunii]